MKFLHAWFLVCFPWAVSLQSAPKSLYEKGGGFAPDERVLYKKAFGKKEKVAEELHLEFFYLLFIFSYGSITFFHLFF